MLCKSNSLHLHSKKENREPYTLFGYREIAFCVWNVLQQGKYTCRAKKKETINQFVHLMRCIEKNTCYLLPQEANKSARACTLCTMLQHLLDGSSYSLALAIQKFYAHIFPCVYSLSVQIEIQLTSKISSNQQHKTTTKKVKGVIILNQATQPCFSLFIINNTTVLLFPKQQH